MATEKRERSFWERSSHKACLISERKWGIRLSSRFSHPILMGHLSWESWEAFCERGITEIFAIFLFSWVTPKVKNNDNNFMMKLALLYPRIAKVLRPIITLQSALCTMQFVCSFAFEKPQWRIEHCKTMCKHLSSDWNCHRELQSDLSSLIPKPLPFLVGNVSILVGCLLKYINNSWVDFHETVYRHSWFPEVETYRLSDFLLVLASVLTFMFSSEIS